MVASAILIRELDKSTSGDECGNSVVAILAPQTPKSSAMPRTYIAGASFAFAQFSVELLHAVASNGSSLRDAASVRSSGARGSPQQPFIAQNVPVPACEDLNL